MELSDKDKMIISMVDFSQSNVYNCEIHGIFAQLKNLANRCVYCKKPVTNITEEVKPLQPAFREEFEDGPWNH